MKYYPIIILFIFVTSCSSTKKTIETSKKNIATSARVEDKVTLKNTIPKKENSELKRTTTPLVTTKNIKDIPPKSLVKNVKSIDTAKVTNKKKIIAFNHNEWNTLLKKHVTNQGNVNYKGFKTERKALLNYIKNLSNNIPNNAWTKEEKLAYWMNAYNAMTIDLILRNYPVKSIKDIKDPWDQRYWKLGKKWINLNQIEHDILREMNDPRIHFGIVCASFSCPKLQNEAFTALQVDDQLTKATKEFLNDPSRNEISKNYYKISKIFQWFSKDFKVDGGVLGFLNKYSDITISSEAKKSYKNYNWALND